MENKTTQNSIKTAENLDQAIDYLMKVPPHTPIKIYKNDSSTLPQNFQKTALGYSKEDELAQYRGPENIHVHEMADSYELHRDVFDPRDPIGAVGHAFIDAPEIGFGFTVGLGSGITIGKVVYEMRKDKSENAYLEAIFWGSIVGFSLGLLTFFAIKRDH